MPSDRPGEWGIAADDSGEDDEESGEESDEETSPGETSEEEAGSGEEAAGEEDEEYDEEAAAEVEEVDAEEEESPKPSRPRARRSGAPGRAEEAGKPSKARIWAVVAAILILVPVMGLAYFFYGPAGEVKEINLVASSYTTTDHATSGMVLAAQVDTGKPSSLSGTAQVAISYNGASVFKGTMEISQSAGTKSFPLNEFAVGNGNYRVEVTFGGHTSATTYTASGIIEKLDANAWNMTHNNYPFVDYGSARIGVTVTFQSAASQTQMATSADKLDIEITGGGGVSKFTESVKDKMQASFNYSIPGNGNYTVKASYQNSKVKAGSQYSVITVLVNDSTAKTPYVTVFIPPKADAGQDQTVYWKLTDGGGKVTLDGGRSMAYSGAIIVSWFWQYPDLTGEEGKVVTYTFPNKNTDENPYYVVLLTVTDSNGSIDTDEVDVTVK